MNSKTKQLVTLAMLTAMAYIVGLYRVRFMGAAPFLSYDAKDVIIVLGGLMFGPIAALTMSVVLAALEMITHSATGVLGMLMNSISSAAFACVIAYIYQLNRTMKGAVLGIVAGVLVATGTMLLWNYLVVPFYTGWPREQVVDLLLPAFLPFNLIQFSLNGAFVLLVYKPIVMTLKTAGLYSPSQTKAGSKLNIGLMIFAGFTALSLCLLIIVLRGNM